jgi:heat-inducible transcriptional repressor
MHDLTERQIQILKALIEEYIETAEAVGSETLEKKYSLSASPATIRNEMVRLSELGYLKKTHTSAGRVPTPLGMRFYVKQLMEKKDLSVTEEVSLKEKVWDYREKEHQFLKEVTKCLADKTGALAIALTEDGRMYASGYANILNMPEFYEIKVMQEFLKALDEFDYFHKYLATMQGEEDTYILMGEELGPQLQGPYGFVFSRYMTPAHGGGEIGVLGPTRLNYTSVVPIVRYFGDLIDEIAKW